MTKGHYKQMKKPRIEWKKTYLQIINLIKDEYSEYIRELLQLNNNKK